jgi:PAS domain S-box-containing protein
MPMSFVLIVSHEIAVQESLRMILKEEFSVLQARSGQEALAMVAHHPVEIVLLEPILPDMNGLSLLERIRQISEDLCVVLISNSKGRDLIEATDGDAGYEVMVKPFESTEVRWVMKRALERTRLRREVRMLKSRVEANGGARPFPVLYREEVPLPVAGPGWYTMERDPSLSQFALKEFFKALTHITDLERLLDFMLHAICEMFQVNKAAVLLLEPARSLFRVRASLGIEEVRIRNLALKLEEGLAGWLLRYNQILRREEVELSGFTREGALVVQQMEALDAKISAPLLTKGRLVGILCLGNKVTGRPFSDSDVEQLSMVGNYAAVAVENSLLYRELSLQKKYNENILKSIGSGVVAIDHLGKITTYNPAAERMLAVSREEILGKSVQKLGSVFADLLLRTLDGSETFSRREVTHPMSKAPLGVSTSPLRDEANRIRGAIMVFTDLTETKELEARTRDLERLRFWSALANRMAQEIRNPLVAVKTFAQLLPERYAEEEFREQFFSVVMGEIDRLHLITERLMEFAMPRESRPVRQDINQVVESALQSRAPWIEAKKLRLVKQLASDPIFVSADREHLEKALCHLLDNGLEASTEGGKLRLRTQRVRPPATRAGRAPAGFPQVQRDWAEILVEDAGCGIPRDQMGEIFSPFFTTKVKGMGFGLPIAQRIIQDHGGRIEVDSEPGKGSRFRILLPLDTSARLGDPALAEMS